MFSLPAISIENLIKRFDDVTAVDGISLQVPEGELFGLLGPNGAGKTTVINVLCGLIQPTKGSCRSRGLRHSERNSQSQRPNRRMPSGDRNLPLSNGLRERGTLRKPLRHEQANT
jgi:ABC-type multidrug transport system ATPase subunit